MLKPTRQWATPLMTGAFVLSAVTGVMLFFHINSTLNKLAHEYLSWVLLTAALCHVLANFRGFVQHFKTTQGRWIIGGFMVLLLVSFYSGNDGPRNPAAPAVRTLASVPLSTLADLSGQSFPNLAAKLQAMGFRVDSPDQRLEQLTGPGFKRQSQVLSQLLEPGSGK